MDSLDVVASQRCSRIFFYLSHFFIIYCIPILLISQIKTACNMFFCYRGLYIREQCLSTRSAIYIIDYYKYILFIFVK